MACFWFYANKIITTGEGGMVTTNDDALAETAPAAAQPRLQASLASSTRRRGSTSA